MNQLKISLTSQNPVTDLEEDSIDCVPGNVSPFVEIDLGSPAKESRLDSLSNSIEIDTDDFKHDCQCGDRKCTIFDQRFLYEPRTQVQELQECQEDDISEHLSEAERGYEEEFSPNFIYTSGLTSSLQVESSAMHTRDQESEGDMVPSLGVSDCFPSLTDISSSPGIEEPPPPYFRDNSPSSTPAPPYRAQHIHRRETQDRELLLLRRAREDYIQSKIEEYYNHILFTNWRWFKIVIKQYHKCPYIGFEAKLFDIGACRLSKAFVSNQFHSWSAAFWITFFVFIGLSSPFIGLEQEPYWLSVPFCIYIMLSIPISMINNEREKRSKLYEEVCTAFARLQPEAPTERFY
ncbi:hypothetical protein J3Q64DRAFT_1858712 [Phycomyces blakesleeanus]|uniref:Transmembrane protein n=2 Tax=Phycomyces blakesleeanus TaxID=4837 RepID=A0A162V397_PHYB8|nr:hypothetical protein PHYBLDRAFT_162708 [Phycomyces blakesleeanus NRRL 1555(-)]OAD79652.1 hypothetical protein PHYBLDRAFT_162708 [Phycomyces blakesleeanus NRRL 1555(-)]|eukprot:XP_018297692.1 hypothetical protein PHYBLDRAFT_162708 [Phycomyces blakesleeanus NRRL 1555(-)]